MAELNRYFTYDSDGQPVMVLVKKSSLTKPVVDAYVIPQGDAWMFSRDHYPAKVPLFFGFDKFGRPIIKWRTQTYEEAMYLKCAELCERFQLGLVTSRRMAEIASVIEDGIDELIAMPPQRVETVTIGEVKLRVSDLKGNGYIEAETELKEQQPVPIH